MSVRLPRLLDANLDEVARLRPSRLEVEEKMTPLSRATMSLPDGEPDVPVRGFVEIYNSRGSMGIYRVCSSVPEYGKSQTVGLKYGLTVLSDAVTGEEETISGSARSVIGALLACQTQKIGNTPFWSLGRVDIPDSIDISVDGQHSNVLQALLDILKRPKINGKYMYTFDQSGFPWVLNVTALTEDDASEARMGRNLTSVSPTYDDGDLVTRVYADGLDNGYMEVSSPFGTVSGAISIPDGVDAKEYATEYLETHKEPRSQIKMDAIELEKLTGDSLDAFYPGRMCRVPLPAYGTMLHFRVVTITYEDLMSDPDSVTIEMSNARDDASYYLANSSSRISQNSSKISKNTSKITEQGIDLRKTQLDLVELDGSVATRFNEVGVRLDEQNATLDLYAQQTFETIDGLRTRISSAEILLDGANAKIDLEGKRIDSLTDEISAAKITIDGANQQITALAGTVDAQGELIDGVSLRLDGIDKEIELKADKIILDGYVTANQFQAEVARVNNFFSGVSVISTINATRATIGALQVGSYTLGWQKMTVVNSFTQALGETQTGDSVVLGVAAPASSSASYTPEEGETITF